MKLRNENDLIQQLEIARQKYHASWKNTLIPVHIDLTLFSIENI